MSQSSLIPATPSVPTARIRAARRRASLILLLRVMVIGGLVLLWHWLTATDVLPAFVFGRPLAVFMQIVNWFSTGKIFIHLGVTLLETLLAFVIGSALGLAAGLWLGLAPFMAEVLDPVLKGINSMPRVVLGPLFAVWFGLGIWSKVWLGVTIVFFLVFFNVFQGVREVSPVVLANGRMLGANRSQLLRMVYLPSAMSWMFASLHNAVGMAFVGAVIGEYLGSARGIGYLILQAEGVFNMNAVIAGIFVLTIFAYALDHLVSAVERRLLVWQR